MSMMLRRTTLGFEPANTFCAEDIQKIKIGTIIEVSVPSKKNRALENKLFALFRVGYSQWDNYAAPIDREGITAMRDLDTYREGVMISAGHFSWAETFDGNVIAKALSLSAKHLKDDDDKKAWQARVYSDCFDVILARLNNYTKSDLQEQVDLVLGFL